MSPARSAAPLAPLVMLALVVALLVLPLLAAPLTAASPGPEPELAAARQPAAGDGRGVTLVLVKQWEWAQARPVAAAARAAGWPLAAGMISTLPQDAAASSRVLSLASGARVDTQALAEDAGPDAVARLRADNPDAALSGLPPTRVLAAPGLQQAGLIALAAGQPATAEELPAAGRLAPEPGAVLVVAVEDAAAAGRLLPRLDRDGRVLLAGLEPSPGRAYVAPFLDLGGQPGLVTSTGTRRDGLVALEDIRPTLQAATGHPARGELGGRVIRAQPHPDPPAAVDSLDLRVAALVDARTWAIPVLVAIAAVAFGAVLLTATRAGRGLPARRARRAARAGLRVTVAVPSGYLIASWIAPPSALLWLSLGLAASAVLAALAARGGGAALSLLSCVLLAVVAADLATGGEALSRPLVGGSAYDGERFYGIGNGSFGYALAAAVLVGGSLPLPRLVAAAVPAGLALLAGLPALGADVGGGLTGMVTAAAVWLLLGDRPLRPGRLLLLGVAALATGLAVALGLGVLQGGQTHATQFVERVAEGGPDAALRVFAHKIEVNLALLAGNPFAWVGPALVALTAAAIWVRPLGLDRADRRLVRAVQAGVVGAVTLIVVNDTGVTAAIGCGLLLLTGLAWALPPMLPDLPTRARPTGSDPASLAALARLSQHTPPLRSPGT